MWGEREGEGRITGGRDREREGEREREREMEGGGGCCKLNVEYSVYLEWTRRETAASQGCTIEMHHRDAP